MGDKEGEPAPGQKSTATSQRTGPKITEINDDDSGASSTPKPDQPAVPDDPEILEMQRILADPANQQILMDPRIQQLIESLRNDPQKAQRLALKHGHLII
jgi:hypothetical protein